MPKYKVGDRLTGPYGSTVTEITAVGRSAYLVQDDDDDDGETYSSFKYIDETYKPYVRSPVEGETWKYKEHIRGGSPFVVDEVTKRFITFHIDHEGQTSGSYFVRTHESFAEDFEFAE